MRNTNWPQQLTIRGTCNNKKTKMKMREKRHLEKTLWYQSNVRQQEPTVWQRDPGQPGYQHAQHASVCPQTPTTTVRNHRVNTVNHTVKITKCNTRGKSEMAMCNFSWNIVWLHYELYGCIMNTVWNCFIISIISPGIVNPCSSSCSEGYQHKSIIGVCIFSPFCCMTVSEEVTLVFMILPM